MPPSSRTLDILVAAVVIGVGATLAIDLYGVILKRGWGLASLSYCHLGRWFLHMPTGRFAHSSIAAASPKPGECQVGWVAHYSIGISLTLAFLLLASPTWLAHPTLLPALAFGIITVLIPFFVVQPALGLGLASARSHKPTVARLKSLGTHASFGFGIYLTGCLRAWWYVSH